MNMQELILSGNTLSGTHIYTVLTVSISFTLSYIYPTYLSHLNLFSLNRYSPFRMECVNEYPYLVSFYQQLNWYLYLYTAYTVFISFIYFFEFLLFFIIFKDPKYYLIYIFFLYRYTSFFLECVKRQLLVAS